MVDPIWRGPVGTLPAGHAAGRLTEVAGLRLLLVRTDLERAAVRFGLVERDGAGGLAIGYGYGEVLLLTERPAAEVVPVEADGLRTVVDLSHALTVLRLTGTVTAELLSRVCSLDLSDDMTPDAVCRRCAVGGLPLALVRDDRAGERSYLLLVDRSYGRSLADLLLDTGTEFGLG